MTFVQSISDTFRAIKEVFARRHMHDADDLTPRVAGLSASRPCGSVSSIIRLFHHPSIDDAGAMQGVGTVSDPAVSDWETGREHSKLLANVKSYSSKLDVFFGDCSRDSS
ncbi:hypothetical protein CC79DRAFT_1369636 [Sarocladium strictum]